MATSLPFTDAGDTFTHFELKMLRSARLNDKVGIWRLTGTPPILENNRVYRPGATMTAINDPLLVWQDGLVVWIRELVEGPAGLMYRRYPWAEPPWKFPELGIPPNDRSSNVRVFFAVCTPLLSPD